MSQNDNAIYDRKSDVSFLRAQTQVNDAVTDQTL